MVANYFYCSNTDTTDLGDGWDSPEDDIEVEMVCMYQDQIPEDNLYEFKKI
jgi:hypothetical protein